MLFKDQTALNQFVSYVEEQEQPLTVLITPYGEALIHDYYWTALAKLTSMSHIRAVGCQTNLSFPVEAMLAKFEKQGGVLSKLRLWCTFHCSMTSVSDFLFQCRMLMQYGIRHSVGVVGNPEDLPIILELRKRLDKKIYLWVNRMDGLRRRYTKEEIQAFRKVDPYFLLEISSYPADDTKCLGGDAHIFVNGNGDYFSCAISHRKLGNLYSSEEKIQLEKNKRCSSSRCSCYLAYHNRRELLPFLLFDTHPAFRIPLCQSSIPADWTRIKAIFFDIDGTLTDEEGHLTKEAVHAVHLLKNQYKLFFATALPVNYATYKCHDVWKCFSGGIFARGADIRIFDTGYHAITPMKQETAEVVCNFAKQHGLRFRRYQWKEHFYKITLFHSKRKERRGIEQLVRELTKTLEGICCVEEEEDRIEITAIKTDKLSGIRSILEQIHILEDEVLVFGNSHSDQAMIEYFSNRSDYKI